MVTEASMTVGATKGFSTYVYLYLSYHIYFYVSIYIVSLCSLLDEIYKFPSP